MSTFRRLKMEASATMTRQVRLLKTNRHLTRYLGKGPVTTGAAGLGNAALRLVSWRRRRSRDLEIALHPGRFDEEFTVLDRRVGGDDALRGRRAAGDLNWRYRDDPLHEYQVLTARRAGELAGFTVIAASHQDSAVVDLFGALSPAETADLLDAAAQLGRAAGLESVSTLISADHPLTAPLRSAGFRPRESGPWVVAYAGAGRECGSAWRLTYSDVMA
jgi:hypothetical protein